MGRPDEIPAVPKYIQEWESPFGPEAAKYPALRSSATTTLARVHSTLDNVDWLERGLPPAAVHQSRRRRGARKIRNGDAVRVWNDRGATVVPCRVTPRIMPGVVALPQGAWWTPDNDGVDRRGSVNVLSSERWTPLAFGNAQHTIMVQVEKAEAA